MIDKIESNLNKLHQTKPLVLCLTNFVTMDFMANILLALGASPIMSIESQEIEELVKISNVVSINIGTLDEKFIDRAKLACISAKKHKKPIVLDPVGAGASLIRTETARELLPFVDIIRGNASEIIALGSNKSNTMGVDATHKVLDASYIAKELAFEKNKVIIVSGPEDLITDGKQHKTLSYGSNIMPKITGMGCCLTAVVAAFKGVIEDSFDAAVSATSYYGLSGQITEQKHKNPASFKIAFIDNIYEPNWLEMKKLYA